MKNRAKIFIPFLDGLLTYDCRECGYACCQSGNLIMNQKEKRKFLPLFSHLRYFFTRETNKTYAAKKYPKCWFLENNGLCHIQKKFGYAYKPFICRLHPFYIVRCKDGYIVTTDSCPALYVGRGNASTSHKQILKNCQEAIDYAHLHGEIDWPKSRLYLEKMILEGSKKFLGSSNYLDFAAYQISITTKNKNIAEIKSKLLDSIYLWKSFLEIDGLNLDNKRLTYELIAYTPLLRVKNIHLRYMQADRVPLALLALYFYMLLFTRNKKTKTYVQTYEQILSDISFGLLYLKNDDLEFKNMSLENKISYLRQLQMLITLKTQKGRRPPLPF